MNMPVTNRCATCNIEFMVRIYPSDLKAGYTRGRYCSYKCARIGKRSYVIRNCGMCGKSFKAQQSVIKFSGKGRFCSKECGNKSRRRSMVEPCVRCGADVLRTPSDLKYNRHRFCSISCGLKGNKFKVGIALSDRHKAIISELNKGEKSRFWKGGITPIHQAIRTSSRYANWRRMVFERDNWTCIQCGRKGNIQADHIKPFSLFPKLRFDMSNGRTLCVSCHKKTDTYGAKSWKRKIS